MITTMPTIQYDVLVPHDGHVTGQWISYRSYDDQVNESEDIVLWADQIDFRITRMIADDDRIVAVLSPAGKSVPDHVRKILQESQIAAGIVSAGYWPADGDLVSLIDGRLAVITQADVVISAINTTLTKRSVEAYRKWGVRNLGYFRNKFALFDMWAADPSSFVDVNRTRSFLCSKLDRVAQQGWDSIRLVLSDPSSHELRMLGVDVALETNPEMGLRGPRVSDRWRGELEAICQAVESHGPAMQISVCIPFVSSAEEWLDAVSYVREIVGETPPIGFTLELPSMWLDLERAIDLCRPAFVGIGTSDLLAFINGADRDSSKLKPDLDQEHNRAVLLDIGRKAGAKGVPFFVCGDARRDRGLLGQLVHLGATELLSSSHITELALVHSIAAAQSSAVPQVMSEVSV